MQQTHCFGLRSRQRWFCITGSSVHREFIPAKVGILFNCNDFNPLHVHFKVHLIVVGHHKLKIGQSIHLVHLVQLFFFCNCGSILKIFSRQSVGTRVYSKKWKMFRRWTAHFRKSINCMLFPWFYMFSIKKENAHSKNKIR